MKHRNHHENPEIEWCAPEMYASKCPLQVQHAVWKAQLTALERGPIRILLQIPCRCRIFLPDARLAFRMADDQRFTFGILTYARWEPGGRGSLGLLRRLRVTGPACSCLMTTKVDQPVEAAGPPVVTCLWCKLLGVPGHPRAFNPCCHEVAMGLHRIGSSRGSSR